MGTQPPSRRRALRGAVWLLTAALGLHFAAVWMMFAASIDWEAKRAMTLGSASVMVELVASIVAAMGAWEAARGAHAIEQVILRLVATVVLIALLVLVGTQAWHLWFAGTWTFSDGVRDVAACVGFVAGVPAALVAVVAAVGVERRGALRGYGVVAPLVMLLAYLLWTAGTWWTFPVFAIWRLPWAEVEAVEKWLPRHSVDVLYCAPRILLTVVLATVCVAVLLFATRRAAFAKLNVTSSAG